MRVFQLSFTNYEIQEEKIRQNTFINNFEFKLKSSYQFLLQVFFLLITHTCPSSSSPPTKLLNFGLNFFLSSQTYLQALISQFEKISQLIFEKRQERSLFLSFQLLFHMNSSSKHSDIRFYGSITIIPQLIPSKFQFIALTQQCVFIFRTFLISD